MKQLLPAIKLYLFMTVMTGLLYPIVITVIGQVAFPFRANGSFVKQNGVTIGSALIAQKFESDRFFWPRPSATDFNPLPSGGSNLGPTSSTLRAAVASRKTKAGPHAPKGLLFASGSGLDPEISPTDALYQLPRVAKARGMPEEVLHSIVIEQTIGRQLGLLGEERINVLRLNLALEERQRQHGSPQ